MSWNPTDYLRFGAERTRPAAELASRIAVREPARIVDLGCGPGNSTQVLRQRWSSAHVTGVDSSPEMIAEARKTFPDGDWQIADIAAWIAADPYDIVYSSAALQWLPDHKTLVARLFDQVAHGGALAFQIPSATFAQVRVHMHDVAKEGPWASRMDVPLRALTMEPPEVYYDVLAKWAKSIDIWESEYYHVMESPEAIVKWIASTGLRPLLAVLDEAEKESFVRLLTQRVAKAYPKRSDGKVLFPFRRTFVVAYA